MKYDFDYVPQGIQIARDGTERHYYFRFRARTNTFRASYEIRLRLRANDIFCGNLSREKVFMRAR